jgi:hypothetical protein
MSHKVARLLVPYALLAVFVASAALAPTSLIYAVGFGVQLGFYALALYGAWLDRRERRAPLHTEEFREAA